MRVCLCVVVIVINPSNGLSIILHRLPHVHNFQRCVCVWLFRDAPSIYMPSSPFHPLFFLIQMIIIIIILHLFSVHVMLHRSGPEVQHTTRREATAARGYFIELPVPIHSGKGNLMLYHFINLSNYDKNATINYHCIIVVNNNYSSRHIDSKQIKTLNGHLLQFHS